MLNPEQKALVKAIEALQVSEVNKLLSGGLSPNFMTEDNMPPLHLITDKVYEWWEFVLDHYDQDLQLDPETKQQRLEPYLQIFNALIDAGANIHLWDSAETLGPLWDCASAGAVPMVERLLSLGVDVNSRDDEGHTILSSISYLVFDRDFKKEYLTQAYPDEVQIFNMLIQAGGLTTEEWEKKHSLSTS